MKRLHVYFGKDWNKIHLLEGDVLYVSSLDIYEGLKSKGYTVFMCKPSDWGTVEKYNINEISKTFLLQFNPILEPLFNAIFAKVMIPVLNVVFELIEIVKCNKIDEIELYGGADVPFFSMNYAEGEGKPVMYRREWTMNYIIYHVLCEVCQVNWYNKENSRKIKFILWLREIYFRSIYKLSLLKRGIAASVKKAPVYNYPVDKPYNLYLCPLLLQYRHLKRLAYETTLGAYYISSAKEDCVYHLPELPLSRLFKLFSSARIKVHDSQLLISTSKSLVNLDFGIGFMKSLKMRFLMYQVEKERYLMLNEKTHIIERAEKIVNNKTIGSDAYLDADLAETFKKDYLTFQYVSLDMFDCPCHKVWSHIYLYSPKMKEYFSSKGFKADVYQEPKLKKTKRTDNTKNIALFLQPDAYNDYSLKASVSLAKIVSSRGKYHLYIKPHYRQSNISEIQTALESDATVDNSLITIVDGQESVSAILSYTDITVGFSSSVLTESVNAEVATVSIVADKAIKDYLDKNEILSKYCWQADGFDNLNVIVDKMEDIKTWFDQQRIGRIDIGHEVKEILS